MRAKKTKVELSSIGKEHTKVNLKRYYPFLRKDFRVLKRTETKSRKVFAELFPNEPENLEWLNAIYTYQQCDTKTREI